MAYFFVCRCKATLAFSQREDKERRSTILQSIGGVISSNPNKYLTSKRWTREVREVAE